MQIWKQGFRAHQNLETWQINLLIDQLRSLRGKKRKSVCVRVLYLVKIPAHTKMSEYLFRKTVLVHLLTAGEDVCIFSLAEQCDKTSMKLFSGVRAPFCVLLHLIELVARTEEIKQA